MELHQIRISAKDKKFISKNYTNGDQIKYKEALSLLVIDLENSGILEN